MWANVNERRKEIGILRMMGASKRIVYQLFIYKSVFLGITGGLAGYVLGTLAGVILGPYLAGMVVQQCFRPCISQNKDETDWFYHAEFCIDTVFDNGSEHYDTFSFRKGG